MSEIIDTAELRKLCEAASAGEHTYAESEFHAAWTPDVAISALDLIDRQAETIRRLEADSTAHRFAVAEAEALLMALEARLELAADAARKE